MGVWAAAAQAAIGIGDRAQSGIEAGKQTRANIEMSDELAADALQRGVREAGQARTEGSQLAFKQHVAFANSGVDASVGTPADVIASTSAKSEFDALAIGNNAAREALGYKKHGLAYQMQAGIDASRRNRETAGTVLGAVGNGMSAYAKDKGAGGNGFGFGS